MSEKKVKNKLIVILGPTACGKTKLAVKLANTYNGEIISADSRQVYKGLDIGTGKDLKEYLIRESRVANRDSSFTKIPYHLIDIISPKKQFSLAQYQKQAYQAIDGILKRKKVPFLVGGTGLYIQAITDGYILTKVKPNPKLRQQLYQKNLKQLQNLTLKYKIRLNQSDFSNKRRLIRAIEKSKSDSQFATRDSRLAKYNCLILGIKYPKEIINKKIDQRLIYRLEKENMVGEVKKLHRQGISWKRLEDFGLEYKWISLYLQKKISYNEMVDKLKIAIHQFAKRQMTWFKRMKNIQWLKNINEGKNLTKKFIK